jgi:heme-degrading monooxygenase HmoA
MTVIDLFEVPPDADDAFLADWESERVEGSVLYRALRDDADFRFAAIAPEGGPYETVHEDGAPDGADGVTLINAFEVPDGEDATFVAGWERVTATLADQRGYLGTRLHRAAGAADFRFVHLARWSSPLMFARATGRPAFLEASGEVPYRRHPALYSVLRG